MWSEIHGLLEWQNVTSPLCLALQWHQRKAVEKHKAGPAIPHGWEEGSSGRSYPSSGSRNGERQSPAETLWLQQPPRDPPRQSPSRVSKGKRVRAPLAAARVRFSGDRAEPRAVQHLPLFWPAHPPLLLQLRRIKRCPNKVATLINYRNWVKPRTNTSQYLDSFQLTVQNHF